MNNNRQGNISLLLEIDRRKLVNVLDTLNPGTSSYCGKFPKLAEVFINRLPRPITLNEIDRGPEITCKINRYAVRRVSYGLIKVRKQLDSIFTLCHKIYNQRELCRKNKLGDEICNSYLSEDIDLFFLKYRFIYDNISEVIRTATETYLDNHDWTFGGARVLSS